MSQREQALARGRASKAARERQEQGLGIGLAPVGFIGAPTAVFAAAELDPALSEYARGRSAQRRLAAQRASVNEMLPGLDQSFLRTPGELGNLSLGVPDRLPTYAQRGRVQVSDQLLEIDWDQASNSAQWRGVYDETAPSTTLEWAKDIPRYGPDLGATRFASGYQPPADSKLAYTVVPNANSARFKDALLPAVVDQVYRRDAHRFLDADPSDFVDGADRSLIPYSYDFPPAAENVKPVPKDALAEISSSERVGLLERMAPGQTQNRNVSGYLWGTVGEYPRYEYARSKTRNLGDSRNPEVVLSEVRTPPELETDYLFTSDTHDPYVTYKSTPMRTGTDWDGETVEYGKETALGPSWGIVQADDPAAVAARRSKVDITGDISFRSDLIQGHRAGWSLADAQAMQAHLGLPLSIEKPGALKADEALEQATEAIRASQGLKTHGEVVQRFGRPLPRMGVTTSPRQPATLTSGPAYADVAPAVTDRLKQAFDLSGALGKAGFTPDESGLKAANQAIQTAGNTRLRAQNRGGGLKAGAAGFAADSGMRVLLGQPLDEAVVDTAADLISAENLGGAPTASLEQLGPNGEFVDTRSNTVLSPKGEYTNVGIAYRNGKPVIVPRGSVAGEGNVLSQATQALSQAGQAWNQRAKSVRKAGSKGVQNELNYVMNSLRNFRLPYFGR